MLSFLAIQKGEKGTVWGYMLISWSSKSSAIIYHNIVRREKRNDA